MSSITTRKYINTYVKNPRGGYQETSIITARIPHHKNGHYVRLNKVVFKYHDFKKYADPNAHVRMFNFVMKANAKTLKSISSMSFVIC